MRGGDGDTVRREEEDSLWGAGGAAGSGDTEKAGAGPRGAFCGGSRGSCTS
jgi:hypothetical protein